MIGFESDEAILQKLRERLRRMTDEELIKFGKDVPRLPDFPRIRFSGNWKRQEKSGSGERSASEHTS